MINIYKNHRLFNYFESNLKKITLEDKFFEGNFFGEKKIKIYFNKYIDEWILTYKEELTEVAKKIYIEKKYDIDFNKYMTLFYFYFWILDDITSIANSINLKIKNILNIGAGIGLLDILLNNVLNIENHHLIEINKHKEKIGIDGKPENLSKEINPLKLLSENIKLQNSKNIKCLLPDQINHKIKYDLILSIRSWGFLYPIEYYISDIKKISDKETIFISDIHKQHLDTFNNFFKIEKELLKEKIYSRYLFRLKI